MGFSNVYGVPGWGRTSSATVLDGRTIAAELRRRVAADVAAIVAEGLEAPGLATILVGDDPASHVYVAAKHRACAEAGIRSIDHRLAADCPPERLADLIADLNADTAVSGILLQLPLPAGLDAATFVDAIDPLKDVDGLSTASTGALWRSRPALTPCTPAGVMELLARSGVDLAGADAVIVGRSELVGRPLAAMLLAANATVTVCHSRTRNLEGRCREADVVVAALGRARAIGAGHVKPGAVVVDVGITRTDDGLVGDVDYDAVLPIAGAITPVPGGVGPMTIACLLRNTVRAAGLQHTRSCRPARSARGAPPHRTNEWRRDS
ncbi:MAG: bifunctional methylenetetrahydrofolate dehydrogenase/methenyltetrahydrofolate cyclohydrolase FolD [Thermoleophilaceae bacterium]